MPRSMVLATETALAASNVCWVLLYELYFPSGTVRFCSAMHDVAWDGNTFIGAGAVAAVEPVVESIAPSALARNIQFSGIDPAYLSAILDDAYQGQTMREYLAILDEHWELIGDPILTFEGRMDEPEVSLGAEASIQLSVENRMAGWDQPRLRRYNHADFTARNPGDMFFEYVEEMQDKTIVWGVYKGPVAPDPLKLLNRTLDKALNTTLGKILGAPFGITKPTVNLARKVGDAIGKVFGW